MNKPISTIETELNEPIIFRTTDANVYKSTLERGSLWLRSDQYYRNIEDKTRSDDLEGINTGKHLIPLSLNGKNGTQININGTGNIGQLIVPHYMVSLHGTSISFEQRKAFGSHTFGIRNLSRLAIDVLYQASLKIQCRGYRYGQVYYQYSALAQSLQSQGGAAICFGDNPPQFLNPLNTDVLRKTPIAPFIEQDEWRIVVFVDSYLENDPMLPVEINVCTSHFYPYLCENSVG